MQTYYLSQTFLTRNIYKEHTQCRGICCGILGKKMFGFSVLTWHGDCENLHVI